MRAIFNFCNCAVVLCRVATPRSSSGLGRRPLTPVTRVRIPYGVQNKNHASHTAGRGFSLRAMGERLAVGWALPCCWGAIMGCVVCWGAHHVYFLANRVFYFAYCWPTIRAPSVLHRGGASSFAYSQDTNHHNCTWQKLPDCTQKQD